VIALEKYKDVSFSINDRVEDLLSRMTLKEKIGQLNQKMFGWMLIKRNRTDMKFQKTLRKKFDLEMD